MKTLNNPKPEIDANYTESSVQINLAAFLPETHGVKFTMAEIINTGKFPYANIYLYIDGTSVDFPLQLCHKQGGYFTDQEIPGTSEQQKYILSIAPELTKILCPLVNKITSRPLRDLLFFTNPKEISLQTETRKISLKIIDSIGEIDQDDISAPIKITSDFINLVIPPGRTLH